MPHKDRKIPWPAWVESIRGSCLRVTVKEALHARDFAIDNGAQKHKACAAAFKSADVTLDNIEYGRVTGKEACKKAADALRKFNTAGECSRPTARRGSNGST